MSTNPKSAEQAHAGYYLLCIHFLGTMRRLIVDMGIPTIARRWFGGGSDLSVRGLLYRKFIIESIPL